jgi:hypothetical protein
MVSTVGEAVCSARSRLHRGDAEASPTFFTLGEPGMEYNERSCEPGVDSSVALYPPEL